MVESHIMGLPAKVTRPMGIANRGSFASDRRSSSPSAASWAEVA